MSNGNIDLDSLFGTTSSPQGTTTGGSTNMDSLFGMVETSPSTTFDIRGGVTKAIDLGGDEDDDVIGQLKKWNDENDFGFKFSNPTIWGESVQVSFESEGPQGGNVFNTYKYELGDKDSLEGLIKFMEEAKGMRMPEIKKEFFSKEEFDATRTLYEMYGGLGFDFEETGPGGTDWVPGSFDYVRVISPPDENGNRAEQVFSFDMGALGQVITGAASREAEALNSFIKEHSIKAPVNNEVYSMAWSYANTKEVEFKHDNGETKSISDLSSEELDEHVIDSYYGVLASSEKIPGMDRVFKEINAQLEPFTERQVLNIKAKYNLSDPEQYKLALDELNTLINKEQNRLFENSEEFQKINKGIWEALESRFGGVIEDKLRREAENAHLPSWITSFDSDIARNIWVAANITFPQGWQAMNIMHDGSRLKGVAEELDSLNKMIEDGASLEDSYNKSAPVGQLAAHHVKFKSERETEHLTKDYKGTIGDRIKELTQLKYDINSRIGDRLIKHEGYQKQMEDIRHPSIFGKDIWDPDLTLDEWQGMLGTQIVQMLGAMVSFGGSTYMQEGGGAAINIITIEAAEKMFPHLETEEAVQAFYKLPLEDYKKDGKTLKGKRSSMLEVLNNGEADLDKAVIVGMTNAGLDLVSNFFVFAKATKIAPKSLMRELFKGNIGKFLGSQTVKEISQASMVEFFTETAQEAVSITGVGAATNYYGNANDNAKRLLEAGGQALLTTGPLVATGKVTGTTINEIRAKTGILWGKDIKHTRNAVNELKKKYNEDFKNGDITLEQRDEIFNELEIQERFVNNIKQYKNLDNEGKIKVLENLKNISQNEKRIKELEEENKKIEKDTGYKSVFKEIEIKRLQEQIIENNQNIITQLHMQNWLESLERLVPHVNSRKDGEFADAKVITFDTREEAIAHFEKLGYNLKDPKTELEIEINRLINNETSASQIGKNVYGIKQNQLDAINEGSITTSNAFHHDVLHVIQENMDIGRLKQIVDGVKEQLSNTKDPELQKLYNLSKLFFKRRYSHIKEGTKDYYLEWMANLSDAMNVLKVEDLTVESGITLDGIGTFLGGLFQQETKLGLDWTKFDAQNALTYLQKYTNFYGKRKGLKLRIPKGKVTIPPEEKKGEEKVRHSERVYQKVEAMYSDEIWADPMQKKNAALMMGYELINETVRRMRNVKIDDISKQDIAADFAIAKDGLFGAIMNYDRSKNNSVMAYLNAKVPQSGMPLYDTKLIKFYKNDPKYANIVQSITEESVAGKVDKILSQKDEVVTDDKIILREDQVRTLEEFYNLDIEDMSFIEAQFLSELEAIIESNPKNLEQEVNKLIEKQLFKVVKEKIGPISQKKEDVKKYGGFVSPTYDVFITNGYNTIIGSFTTEQIRTKYKTLFERESIGKTDHKKINPETNRVSNYRKDIFISTVNKAKFIKHFTQGGYTTLVERQNELARLISKSIMKKVSKNYIVNNSGDINVKVEAKINGLIESMNYQQQEIQYVDKVRHSENINAKNNFLVDAKTRMDELMKTKKFSDKGKALEQAIIDIIKKWNIPGLGVAVEYQSEQDGLADITLYIEVGGKRIEEVGIEVKLGAKVRMPSTNVAYDFENGKIISKIENIYGNIIDRDAYILDNSESINEYYEFINEVTKRYNEGEVIIVDGIKIQRKKKDPIFPIFKKTGDPIMWAAHKLALKEGLATNVRESSRIEIGLDKVVEQTYLNKKHPSNYIEFFGHLFAIGKDILFNGDISVLKGNITVEIEMSSSGRTANKSLAKKYGVDVVKVTPRIMPKNPNITSKSTGSITNENFIRDLMAKHYPSSAIIKDNVDGGKRLNNAVQVARSAFDKFQAQKQRAKQFVKNLKTKEAFDKFQAQKQKGKEFVESIKPQLRQSENVRGISILDFDDTLATTKSNVLFTAPDGTKGKLNAEEYARDYVELAAQGYVFDFSEFNKVVKGKPAPLLNKAKKLAEKFGTKDMFILTARPPAAQEAIYEFLKNQGLNIPIDNITGLGNSTSEAKALWIADKVAEGYNDFYFADDALQNVQAVQNMLNQFDVKSKIQQAKVRFSENIDIEFNNILEEVTGIESKKRFSAIKARKRGEKKGRFRFFIPPSHEDFVGLLYNFIGRGKQGNKHRDFFEEALIKPLNRAYRELNTAKQSIANDYKSLNKKFKNVKNKLTKKTPDGDFTYQDAIRVYLWDKHGYEVPGLSKTDQQSLVDLVMNDPELIQYAEILNVISKQDTYVKPTETWETGDIRVDLEDATGRVGREQFFTEFFENADIIFSQENLNKIEAAYGASVVSAIKDILYRTKTGRNRPSGQNKLVNQFMNYLNGSVASTMFFNIRSAVLQQMSMVNFINFADNNIYAAAKAFFNQKQYWADWATIFNSDFMKQRRKGIQTDVNGAELAASVKKSANPVQAVIKKLLELGFLPTQIGDNIAIATGGATFLRNRINTYLKQGMTKKEAESKAWIDFQALAEATQQSARPDMVSQQQASPLGKIILAFQNVTSQFNRLGKKAFLDIKNRRITPGNTTQLQSDMSNLSRIAYYFAIQNLVFYSLQSALFMALFEDDEEDEKFLKKKERIINGSIDSVLRGAGVWGAAVATVKNMAIKWHEQREKGYNADESAVLMEMLNVSPPLGIKARKLVNAEKTLNYNKKTIEEMETLDIDNPMWSAVTNYVEATTNVPVNRLYNKTQNIRESLDNQHNALERVLMFSGWSKWNLGIEDVKKSKKKEKFGDPKKKRAKPIW